MKFSVLIPVYNTEKYLEECLQSVLKQTYQDFEIIVVDDGSTDNSGAICDNFQKAYPEKIIVIHKENQGLISARRVGIANASGDYCIFVDSDDSIKNNLLENLYDSLIVDTSIDLLIYSYCYIKDGLVTKNACSFAEDNMIWDNSNKNELYQMFLFSNNVTPMWIKAVRTTILKSDPTDYSKYYGKNMAEDVLQSLYILTEAKRTKYRDLILYNYNYNDESISRLYTVKSIGSKNMVHVYELIVKKYLKLWSLDSEEMINRVYATNFNGCMYMFFRCYEDTLNKRDVLAFGWDSFLVSNDVQLFSVYANQTYLRIYSWWKQHKFVRIRVFFIKKKIYKFFKNSKDKVFNNES